MDSEIMKNRVKAVRRLLNKKKIDCLVVTKAANVAYATGFSGDDSWVVITSRGVYFLTDSRYVEQARGECTGCRIIQRSGPLAAAVGKLIKRLKSVETVNVEQTVSLADLAELKKNVGARVKVAPNIVGALRVIKDGGEVAAIGAAARLAGKALAQMRRYIRPGITENSLAGRLDFEIRKLGGRNSFETIVAFGPNASRPHHQPGIRKLKKNDTVLIDFGVKHRNYCCDLTRCFAVGRPTALYQKVYRAVQEAQAAAIRTVKAGVELRHVDSAAREAIARCGLPVYGHGTGHGLGLEVHEEPVVSKKGKGELQAAMVFTIEPGVYMPGKLGVRIEDDILVTETGYKILSRDLSNKAGRSGLSSVILGH